MDIVVVIGVDVIKTIFGGQKVAATDVISDQIMDLLTYQLNKVHDLVVAKKEQFEEARKMAAQSFQDLTALDQMKESSSFRNTPC